MDVALAIFGVAFAAFCVWLGVRIVNRREPWAKRTLATVIVGLPVLYVASFGPACWSVDAGPADLEPVARIYRPLVRMACGGGVFASPLQWYCNLNRPRDTSPTAIRIVGMMNFYLTLFDAGEL